MRFVLIGILVLIAAGVGYVLAWPTRIEPVVVAGRSVEFDHQTDQLVVVSFQ